MRSHRMHLLQLVLGVLLLSEVYCLKCQECVPEISDNCTVKQCSPNHRCAYMKAVSYADGAKVTEKHLRGCVSPSQCTNGSANSNLIRTVVAADCCDTDLCNTQPEQNFWDSQDLEEDQEPLGSPNGITCYFCDGSDCSKIVNCLGIENQCFSAKVPHVSKVKGCASKAMCSSYNLADTFGALFGAELTCCWGNLCNSASSTGASLLLLVVPFISLVLFY